MVTPRYLMVSTLPTRATDVQWMEVPLLFPAEVLYQFFSFANIEQEMVLLTPVLQEGDLPSIGRLVIVED